MSDFRTPLSRARGKGAAGHGVSHWIAERVSSAALVPLTLWAIFAVIRLAGLDYYGAVAWIGSPLNATLMALTVAIGFWHMHAGVRVIVEDYVETTLSKTAALLANLFICGLAGSLAVLSILKVALGGG